MPKHIHSQIALQIAKNTQSTHDLAAEATASRLLPLLRQRAGDRDNGSPWDFETQKQAYQSLLAYFHHLDANTENPQSLPDDIAHHPIAFFYQSIRESGIEPDQKKWALDHIKQMLSNYPGGIWIKSTERDDEKWATNQFYDAASQTMQTTIASPAETLELVCRALLSQRDHYQVPLSDAGVRGSSSDSSSSSSADSTHTSSTEISSAKWMKRQTRRLIHHLLNIKSNPKVLCTGGYQHEMLWVLQGAYLDNDGQLFQFVGSRIGFLLQQLTQYLHKRIQKLSKEEQHAFMIDWIAWSKITEDAPPSPCELLLDRFSKNWRETCAEKLREQCARIGLNPVAPETQQNIEGNIALLPALDPTTNRESSELLAWELYEANPAPESGAMEALAQSRNAALRQFQQSFRTESTAWTTDSLSDLYEAEHYFQQLMRYRHTFVILVGEDDLLFQNAALALHDYLLAFFNDDTLGKRLDAAHWEPLKEAFLQQEKNLKGKHAWHKVENFFAHLRHRHDENRLTGTAFFNFINAIHSIGISELRMTDAMFEALNRGNEGVEITVAEHRESVPELGITLHHERTWEMQAVTSLSSYDINRILLHGHLQHPKKWSEAYKNILRSVCMWLLSPVSETDSISLQALKQGYPPDVLPNMLLMTLVSVTQPELNHVFKPKQDRAYSLYCRDIIAADYFWGENNGPLLISDGCFPDIIPYLPFVIRNGQHLLRALRISPERLNNDNRTRLIRAALGDRLENLNGLSMINLLNLPLEKFDDAQRAMTWDAIIEEGHLDQVFQTNDDLLDIFKLDLTQFSNAQRTQVLRAETLRKRLGHLLVGLCQTMLRPPRSPLIALFNLPLAQFDHDQRTLVLEALMQSDNFSKVFSGALSLETFFRRTLKKLNSDQRTLILTAPNSQLTQFIPTGFQLVTFFALPTKKFNKNQRAQLLRAFSPQLGEQLEPLLDLLEQDKLDDLLKQRKEKLGRIAGAFFLAIARQCEVNHTDKRLFALLPKGYQITKHDEKSDSSQEAASPTVYGPSSPSLFAASSVVVVSASRSADSLASTSSPAASSSASRG